MGYQRRSQTRKTEGNSQPQGERSASYTPHPIEELQGLIGNRAMGRILQAQRMSQESEGLGDSALGRGIAPVSQGSILRKPLFRGLSHELMAQKEQQGTLVQAKLMVGKADDRYEEEADRVAAQVVQQIDGQTPQLSSQGETVQREEMEERFQRKPSVASLSVVEGGMAAPRELEAAIQGARGSGQLLEESVREPMEQAFGADFSGVRVHADAKSDELNQSLSSRAFTTGEDIFFRQGEYEPENRKELIAHELTHVVQQSGGGVQQKQPHDQGLDKEADVRMTQTEQGIRHHITPPHNIVQGWFIGLPQQKKVRGQALKRQLEVWQIQVLEWAAIYSQEFGDLQAYLDNPELITQKLLPIAQANRQRKENPKKHKRSDSDDSDLQSVLSSPKRRNRSAEPTPLNSSQGRPPTPGEDLMDEDMSVDEEEEPTLFSLPSIEGRPLILGEEPMRGTLDLPEDSDEELDEFRIGLSEGGFGAEELELVNERLLKRQAPHDRQRRELIAELRQQRNAAIEAGEDDDYYDEPYLADSDEESGTDSEGSDTDDDWEFDLDSARQGKAAERLKREKKLLKPDAFKKKLNAIRKEKKPKKRIFEIFKKGEKPDKKKFYRKESKFKSPSSNVGDRAKLPYKPTEQQIKDLATLNTLLTLGVPIAVAEQLVDSKFVVAQYRGLFYARSGFNHQTREQHRNLDERDQPAFSSSALAEGQFGTGGYYYLYNDPSRREDLALYQNQLMLEGMRIHQALLALRQQKATEDARQAAGRATAGFQPQTMADISTHLYSEKYDEYHKLLAESLKRDKSEPSHPLDPIFRGLPNASNPKVSTGDVPTHAARYAYGLKAYKGHEENVLEPEYDEQGKPKHPYSGKMYVSIHPLTDYEEESGPSQLVPLQNEGRINIGQVIIPERETQFEGWMEKSRVMQQFKAKFPDFSKRYLKVYQEKYGLDEVLFTAFQKAFQAKHTKPGTVERVFIEALLSNYLAMHSELKAIDAAIEEATQQGAILVYRTGSRSFGFEPPAILKSNSKPSKSASPQGEQPNLKELLKTLIEKNAEFQTTSNQGSTSSQRIQAPEDVEEQVTSTYGEIIKINGQDIACYIRSLVTAAVKVHNVIEEAQIENIVNAIQDHLQFVDLRTRGQMINAGGLVAAEVRRVLNQLSGQVFNPEVHVVMWDDSIGQITNFQVNTGTQSVWLYYTPGHFNLINRR